MGFQIAKHIAAKDAVSSRRWFDAEEVTGIAGFQIELAHLSKKALESMVRRCIKSVYDRQVKRQVERLDNEALYALYAQNVVLNWKGLDVGGLKKLVAIKVPEGTNDNTPVDYSEENVIHLLDNARALDNWITEKASSPENFIDREEVKMTEDEVKN